MGPLDHLDMSADELAQRVQGEVWGRWRAQEPILRDLDELAQLRQRRGAEADQLLGALVRLAAQDGGDDELAARAVVHQMAYDAQRLAHELRDLSPDIDCLVLGSLWMEIRSFPWRRRTRAFATSLWRGTKRSVLRDVLSRESERGRVVVRAPEDISDGVIPAVASPPEGATAAESRQELVDYLDWCVYAEWISREDALLMLELVAAGWQTAGQGVLKLKRGVCSLHAVEVVARRREVCSRTVIRERDRVLGILRDAAAAYLREVA